MCLAVCAVSNGGDAFSITKHRQLAKMLLLACYRAAVVTAVVPATTDSGNVGFYLDYQKK
jgi:hypothetical protein